MTVEELVQEVDKLTVEDQRVLASEIELRLAQQTNDPDARRRAAMRSFLLLAGTAHSDFADVSSDKYKHLGEVYADDHENE